MSSVCLLLCCRGFHPRLETILETSSCCEQSERLVFGPSPTWQCLRLMTGSREERCTQKLVLLALYRLLSSHLWYTHCNFASGIPGSLMLWLPWRQLGLLLMCTPRYFPLSTTSSVCPWSLYSVCLSKRLLLFIRITQRHFSGWNCICHSCFKFSKRATWKYHRNLLVCSFWHYFLIDFVKTICFSQYSEPSCRL